MKNVNDKVDEAGFNDTLHRPHRRKNKNKNKYKNKELDLAMVCGVKLRNNKGKHTLMEKRDVDRGGLGYDECLARRREGADGEV
jgi:hypothetical protein